MSSVRLDEVRADGYHKRTDWVQRPDSHSGLPPSRGGPYEPDYSPYPVRRLHDRDNYLIYRDDIGQERNSAGKPYQDPPTACHSPSIRRHDHDYRYSESTADSRGGLNPLAFTRESNPQYQVPFPPTAIPAKVYSSSGLQAPSSHDNNARLIGHSSHYHSGHNHTEHHPLSVNSKRITSPPTADYENDRTPGYETRGRGQDGYNSVMRHVTTPASIARPTIASPAVVAASRARRNPGKQAAYRCPHCDSTFTASHNLQSHIRSHFGVRPFNCKRCGRGFGTKHDCKRHEKSCKT